MSRYSAWPPYVPVAERKKKAEKKSASMKKQGKILQPVIINGRSIANTFWGKAWCDNLEIYSDWANRLPRGRTYVRNGSVLDLQIDPGKITALVMGSELYKIDITIQPLESSQWQSIQESCSGKIDSMIELLQGKLSKGVMEVITKPKTGLFPQPREIDLRCSCPDYAGLCKHLAAVLYGVGARLDQQPELLFLLRQVDHSELFVRAVGSLSESKIPDDAKRLDDSQLSSLFGIDLEEEVESTVTPKVLPPPQKPAAKVHAAKSSKRITVATPTSTPMPAKSISIAATPPSRALQLAQPIQVTARELTARGIPHSTLQNWLASKVLSPSGTRGVYLTTEQTEIRIQQYLEKRPVR